MRGIFRITASVAAICVCLFIVVLTVVGLKRVVVGGGEDTTKADHVEVLDLSGVIVTSEPFLKSLKAALDLKSTKVIIVRINSPGGIVAPSQEIYEALRQADAKVPVIISMSSLAASGGYYAALAGRKIYANPGTLTASIGVIMEFVNTERLYNWAKMERFALKSGKYKDIGSPFRPMRPDEKELLQNLLMNIYGQFRGVVKVRRGLDDAALDRVADGRIVSGEQAKTEKLVDDLKTLNDVIVEARTIAKLPEDAPINYRKSGGSLFQKIFFDDANSTLAGWMQKFGMGLIPVGDIRPGWHLMFLAPLSS